MHPVPPPLLRIAREFLGLSQDDVAGVLGISRKTIAKMERDKGVVVHYVATVQRFYEDQGIKFVAPSGGEGWGVFNANTKDDPMSLNRLGDGGASRPKVRRPSSVE
ncbi:helix-turn-helix transcriptional regulator [Rhizobium leguminosarum]|uniref:helix-turn-helix domain-containing protein n=1 Tax=Rhizobium leguminosarum TaxID=384 RepID=UPI001C97C2F9|nr:helix-turn-helix transcriptional regulator [Rhizobium leguminosarum]MBY5363510.1 helix-turn-helix transcriptional regulator [Rhizobium leguminosarum]